MVVARPATGGETTNAARNGLTQQSTARHNAKRQSRLRLKGPLA
jgi:hypothetical protein